MNELQRITFQASQVELSEVQSNDIYMSVLMRMFSTRPNRNGYAVSEAFIDNILANMAQYTCLLKCPHAPRLCLRISNRLPH